MSLVADHWHELVTAALLGTDRRDPPDPPPGPLADAVADCAAATPSGRMLADVAACTAVRRAGLRPHPPATPLAPPDVDGRRSASQAAARRWRSIAAQWPVLEDEWLAVVEARNLRLPVDVLVGLLRRHGGDAMRWSRVMRLGDPLATWLVEQRPDLAARAGRTRRTEVDEPPVLAVPPDLLPLLTADTGTIVRVIVAGVLDGSFAAAHRAVLVNFVARVRPDACRALADALREADPPQSAVALVHLLADLAETRHQMLEELS